MKNEKIEKKSILLALKYALRNRIAAETEIKNENSLLLTFDDGKMFELKITETV